MTAFVSLLLTVLSADDAAQPFVEGTRIEFAAVEVGAAALKAEDVFTSALSRFDVQSRLMTEDEVSAADLRRFAAEQVRAFSGIERERLQAALADLARRLEKARLQPLLPERIVLIKTTGREEGGAAYCRGAAIVLPEKNLLREGDALTGLLAHELFHILSRNQPRLRGALYEIVGFEACRPIDCPAALRDRRITNPDAPHSDCVISLDDGGGVRRAAPILFASADEYDAERGGPFFRFLQFRLMEVERNDGRWRPTLDEGRPILIDPAESPSFQRQIGGNTDYVIHPEEILAENFRHLVMETTDLPSPRVVERLRSIVCASPPPGG